MQIRATPLACVRALLKRQSLYAFVRQSGETGVYTCVPVKCVFIYADKKTTAREERTVHIGNFL